MSSWSDMIKNKSTDEKVVINRKKKQVKSTLNSTNNETNNNIENEIYRTYGLKNVEEEYDYKLCRFCFAKTDALLLEATQKLQGL